ncbi:MAG: hypothetical protein F4190_02100, partial [Acidimicrobiales bacterium]|nr:hypothetical protein [Acidimicrobiales bacterium]
MRHKKGRTALVVLLPVLAVAATLAVPVSAHTASVYLDGAERWTESDCEGETPIVVASDSRAQSDIYAAVTLAGVLETDCVILAGARNEDFPADQLERFGNSEGDGWIVGGTGAISETKASQLGNRDMTRIAGETRWNTTANVGRVASGKPIEASAETDSAEGFAAITASAYHNCGLRQNGTVECWGSNRSGESSPPSGAFTAIAIGVGHSCGIRENGTVECWGDNWKGRSSPPSGAFTAITASAYHNCGIRENGTVACWGLNE